MSLIMEMMNSVSFFLGISTKELLIEWDIAIS